MIPVVSQRIRPMLFKIIEPQLHKEKGALLGTMHDLVSFGWKRSDAVFFDETSKAQACFQNCKTLVVETNFLDSYGLEMLKQCNEKTEGMDFELVLRAHYIGKEILGLETKEVALQRGPNLSTSLQEVISRFLALARKTQELVLSMDPSPIVEAKDIVKRICKAIAYCFAEGDPEKLGELRGVLNGAPEEELAMLSRATHAKWSERIDQKLRAQDDGVFVAVGVGHVVGEGSLIQNLQNKGWIVRQSKED